MSPDIQIRRASMEDYDSVCTLFQQLDAYHVELLPDDFQPFTGPARSVERFREKVSSPDKALFVAVFESTLVGFIDVQRDSNPPFPMFKKVDFALVDNLFVSPELRGTGVAHALFERAKTWSRENGLSRIRLKVYSANSAATSFYRKEGLLPVSTTFEIGL